MITISNRLLRWWHVIFSSFFTEFQGVRHSLLTVIHYCILEFYVSCLHFSAVCQLNWYYWWNSGLCTYSRAVLRYTFSQSYKRNRSLFCTVSYFILLLSATLVATELLLNYSFTVSVTLRHMNIEIWCCGYFCTFFPRHRQNSICLIAVTTFVLGIWIGNSTLMCMPLLLWLY